MRRCALAVTFALGLLATVRADVAPYPVWSVVTNGTVAGAAQVGGALYFGGTFTKVGRGVAPFEGFLRISDLTLTTDPGCARNRGGLIGPGLFQREQGFFARPWVLQDGAGPFVVADDVLYVRVGSDCRFDRHFALRLPVSGTLQGLPVYVGDRLYAAVRVSQPSPGSHHIAAFDARTGDLIQAWSAPIGSALAGVGVEGRLAMIHFSPWVLTLGFFDPTTGAVSTARTVPAHGMQQLKSIGSRALVGWINPDLVAQLELCDLATWQRLPGWPDVRHGYAYNPQFAASATRLVLDGSVRIDGAPGPPFAVFDLETGAQDQAWSIPAWLADSRWQPGGVQFFTVVGSRLVVSGDFVPGAPRDTVAALDLATGALDPWVFPFAVTQARRVGDVLYVGEITSTSRVARRYFAAVDPVTGDFLPWEPSALLPASESTPVSAFAQAGTFVYAAQTGGVRRYDLLSAAQDTSWRLDVLAATGAPPASVTRLAFGPDVLYATGSFDQASAEDPQAFQTRNGGSAVRLSGGLTPWNPRVRSTCSSSIYRQPPWYYPCIKGLAVTPDRVFLNGWLSFLEPPSSIRSFAAVATDTGALDAAIPSAGVSGLTSAADTLFATVLLENRNRVVRIDPGLQITVLPTAVQNPLWFQADELAVHNGRVYAGAELDDLTGAATGNPKLWSNPAPAEAGLLEIGSSLDFHPDLTTTPPGTPRDLTSSVSATHVVLRWTRASTDLQPLVLPPAEGGTAATSHVIGVSLTPGGPPLAHLDTGSADTTYSVTAPSGVFFVRVQARNAFGISGPSNEVRIEVRPSAPEPPVATVATVTGSAVRLQWQAAPQGWPAVSYVLEAGSRPGASDITVVPVSGIEFRAIGVPPGRYYVRVRAVNANGMSAPGQEVLVEAT